MKRVKGRGRKVRQFGKIGPLGEGKNKRRTRNFEKVFKLLLSRKNEAIEVGRAKKRRNLCVGSKERWTVEAPARRKGMNTEGKCVRF